MFMLESPRFILCKGREHKTIRDRDLYFTNIGKDRVGEDRSTGGVSMEEEDPYQDRVNDGGVSRSETGGSRGSF